MVRTELHSAVGEGSLYLPCTCLWVVSHVGVGIPVTVYGTNNRDRINLSDFVGVLVASHICVDLIESGLNTWEVATTIILEHTFYVAILPVTVPIVFVWTELELAIEPVVTLIDTIEVRATQRVNSLPIRLVTDFIDKLSIYLCLYEYRHHIELNDI